MAAVLFIGGCGNIKGGNDTGFETANKPDGGNKTSGFILTSRSFSEGSEIPEAQACRTKGGANQSPQLSWSNAPAGTAGFALIMDDENPPCGARDKACRHWSVYNIPASVTSLEAGQDPAITYGAAGGSNYTGGVGYAGPCPPSRHAYRMTIYALKEGMPPVSGGAALTRSQFEAKYSNFILARATLTGFFESGG